jgi:EEF1A lysine methyltransferase 2
VNAPQKILGFLTSHDFPLAPCHGLSKPPDECPSVLDLGTGNGQTLFQLRLQGKFTGQLVGVDYSEASIELARELGKNQAGCKDIEFDVMDIIDDNPGERQWWRADGFDLVLDKGTFDAISLSEAVVSHSPSLHPPNEASVRTHTVYPSRALSMVKPGGFLLVTSCNWTQEELIHWFTTGEPRSSHCVSVWKTIEYPKFKFGGHEGQGVCTVCFKRDAAG